VHHYFELGQNQFNLPIEKVEHHLIDVAGHDSVSQSKIEGVIQSLTNRALLQQAA
jgi:hypothetical protein